MDELAPASLDTQQHLAGASGPGRGLGRFRGVVPGRTLSQCRTVVAQRNLHQNLYWGRGKETLSRLGAATGRQPLHTLAVKSFSPMSNGLHSCSNLITWGRLLDYIPQVQLEFRENSGAFRLTLSEFELKQRPVIKQTARCNQAATTTLPCLLPLILVHSHHGR